MSFKNQFFDLVDLDYFYDDDEEAYAENTTPETTKKQRGRPPLYVENPLDDLARKEYVTRSGQPTLWLDDVLTGAIRIVGDKDRRKTTRSAYVNFWKVFQVLLTIRGTLTPKRVSETLRVSYDLGWRIVSVIKFFAMFIEQRYLK